MYPIFHVRRALLIWSLSVTVLADAPKSTPTYTIRYDSASPRNMMVSARFPSHDGQLRMDWEGADFLNHRWGEFVRDLAVTDGDGNAVAVHRLDGGRWKFQSDASSAIVVNYGVDISHDTMPWPAGGHDESAYSVNGVTFAIGRALFMTTGDTETSTYQVTFDLALEDQVVTPWLPSDRPQTYLVPSTDKLVGVPVQMGRLHTARLARGGAEVVIATGPEFRDFAALILPHFERLLAVLPSRLGTIESNRFVVHANRAPATAEIKPYFSGGAFPQTMSLIGPDLPDENMLPTLQYIVSHEFIHLWNPVAFGFAEPEREYWFSEGITDFITLRTLLDLGLIDRDGFLNGPRGIGANYDKYRAVAGPISMREAGLAKFDHYDLVYSGGFVVATWLDAMLRAQSGGEDRIEDVVLALVVHRVQHLEGYTYSAVREMIASKLVDPGAFRDLAARSIDGADAIDLTDVVRAAGIRLQQEEGPTRLTASAVATPFLE